MNPFSDNEFKKSIKKLESKDKFSIGWSLVIALVCMVLSAGLVVYLNFSEQKTELAEYRQGFQNFKIKPDIPFLRPKENILILGVDSNGKHSNDFHNTRSDTIIIISLDAKKNSINAISIPRDSKIFLAGTNKIEKINSAHAYGGPKLTKRTIEETFGLKIDHYIVVDYKGVKEFIDAIGGIPINVEKRMRYTDKTAGLKIRLQAGKQVLNAEEAEQYLRFRHDPQGDIGRVKRQQHFARSVVKKIQSPKTFAKIPELIHITSKYIKTDMNFYELMRIASWTKKVNLNNIQTAILPGRPSSRTKASYWILDAEKTQEVINRLVYRIEKPPTKKTLSVSIIYSSTQKNRMNEVKSILKENNYKIACTRNLHEPISKIISHTNYASFALAKNLRKLIPELKDVEFNLEPNNYYCGKSDYTIVLSGNNN